MGCYNLLNFLLIVAGDVFVPLGSAGFLHNVSAARTALRDTTYISLRGGGYETADC